MTALSALLVKLLGSRGNSLAATLEDDRGAAVGALAGAGAAAGEINASADTNCTGVQTTRRKASMHKFGRPILLYGFQVSTKCS